MLSTVYKLIAKLYEERRNGRMMGLKLSRSLLICEQMLADDLGIFIRAQEESFAEVESCISLYEQASGAKLNLWKSMVIPLGLRNIP